MKIVRTFPPLYSEIDRVFHVRGKPIIFAWGETIFAPAPNGPVSPWLQAHESVHGRRQLAFGAGGDEGILSWWQRYIADPAFRLAEEIPAHQAEYNWFAKQSPSELDRIAKRLASPLYGGLMSIGEARRIVAEPLPDMVAESA